MLTNLLNAFKRRYWIVLLFLVTIAPIAAGFAYILPPVYSASAKILVESQQIPDALARSTVTASSRERVALLTQLLLTRQNIIEVIERHDLYADNPRMTLAAKVDKLRADVSIGDFDPASVGRGPRRGGPLIVGMSISFKSNRPVLAAAVANEFVSVALDLNQRQRTERATETVAFFDEEARRLTRELIALEARIISFKRENREALPSLEDFRRNRAAELDRLAFDLPHQLVRLGDQRQDLVISLQLGGTEVAAASSQERQLTALRSTLLQQRTVLAPSHPQIRALEARIAALESEISVVSDTTGDVVDLALLRKNQIERQIQRIDEQIVLIEQRLADVARDREALEAANSQAPQVQIELATLERQFSSIQANLSSVEAKRGAAATGERLEVNQQAERFVVIEQAQVPRAPIAPNRTVIAGGGVALSLALGVALIVLLELMNKSIRSAEDMNLRVGLRPIVVVPYIHTAREMRARRLRIAMVVGMVLIIAPLALYLVDQNVAPLSILAERVMQMSGLDNLVRMVEQRL